jgi:predicted secreted protein
MAAVAGKNGSVKICATGGVEAELCNVTNWKAHEAASTIDTTGMCSNGVQTNIPGPVKHDVSISGKWESTEADMIGSPPTIAAGVVVDYELYPDDSLTNFKWSGTGTIIDYAVDCPYDGLLTFELQVEGSGTLTKPTAYS